MKRIALPLLLASTMLVKVASAQSSSTPVIGYYKQTINEGNNPIVCGFTTKKDFQGGMSSVAPGSPSSVISQTGANWTVDQFQTSANPSVESSHFVEILTGANAGLVLDVISNTASTVTVAGDLAALAGSETYCIRKHVTLGSLLPGGGGLDAGSDSVSIVNSDASIDEFIYNGGNWENVATLDDGSSKVIYPGQGFIISRGVGAGVATITIGGNDVSYVKSGPTKVPLFGGTPSNPVRNYVGSINPLVSDTPGVDFNTLGNFGLVDGLAAGSDTVDVFSLNGSFATLGTYISNGGNLEDVGSLDDGTTVEIRNGTSFRVIVSSDTTVTVPQTTP